MSATTEYRPVILPWHTDFYDIVVDWWKGHKQDPIPEMLLPAYGAFAINDDGELRAAAWYSLDPVSSCAHLDFLVTNPKNSLKDTPKFALPLLAFLCGTAQENGASHIWANVRQPWLERQAGKIGFEPLMRNQTTLLKALNCE